MADDKKTSKIPDKAREEAKRAVVAAIEKEAKKAGATVLTGRKAGKQEAKKTEEKSISGEAWDTLRFVLMTEKCVRMIEADNVLVFVADRKADKHRIKSSFEKAFGSKVENVRTVIDQDGRKKAYIRLKETGAAGDIAIRLGII